MPDTDPITEAKARQAIKALLDRGELRSGRKRAYLVSYPRSGNTLTRRYFAILQGRPQSSAYPGDVVNSSGTALTGSLNHVEIIKTHQMPTEAGAMIYLVRDGRNATLSFLYMAFLFGGHRFSALSEVYDGIRHLDETEGCWADHVAQAFEQSKTRQTLFVRYEDLIGMPEETLARITRFLGADVPAEILAECVCRQKASDDYGANPYSGYLYEPAKNSIYDILKRHRRDDYWRYIFDDRSRRHFHDCGGTRFLLHFDYERSADWWKA